MKNLSFSNFIVSPLIMLGFWFTMSGFFDFIHGTMGVLCVAFVFAVNYPLRKYKYFKDDVDVLQQLRFGRLILYVFWLIYQIIKAGIQVARLILSPKLPVNPRMLHFKVDLPSAQAKMILGNSITLTPGTLTVDINGDEFIVHAIMPQSMESLINDEMPRQVLKLFSRETYPVVSEVEILTDRNQS